MTTPHTQIDLHGAEVFAAAAFSMAASVDLRIGGLLVAILWAPTAEPNRALLTNGQAPERSISSMR
jgi:hypothetical protein